MTDFDAIAIAAADERLDAERGKQLFMVEQAYARRMGIEVSDIRSVDQARIGWLLDINAHIEAMTDDEFEALVNECDAALDEDRYNETRATLAEWCSQ